MTGGWPTMTRDWLMITGLANNNEGAADNSESLAKDSQTGTEPTSLRFYIVNHLELQPDCHLDFQGLQCPHLQERWG